MDSIRSLLQPLSHNLPAPIREIGLQLLGAECYKTLILDIDPTSVSCMKLAISKALGIGIIAASSIVKIPQLLKLLSSRSAAGISFSSYVLETASYLITLAYSTRNGFPFSTYGETALIAVQDVAIAALVLVYGGKGSGIASAGAFGAGVAAGAWALFNEDVVSAQTLGLLQAGAGLLGVASKAPQIWTVWRAGGTGQLSAFAVFNYLLGSLARVFTTLQEVDDKIILAGYLSGFVLNAILAFQMLFYWNSASPKRPETKRREAHKSVRKVAAISTASGNVSGSGSGSEQSTPRHRGPSTRRRG